MVAGIVLFAFGLETTLHHVDEPLALCPRRRCAAAPRSTYSGTSPSSSGRPTHPFRRRTIGAAVLLVLIPVVVAIPALASLVLVSAVCSLVVGYEAIRHRADRARLRHA